MDDTLGDKCKAGEEVETLRKASIDEYLMVRLDGKGFSKFTKGLNRPYDSRMSLLMIDTLKYLVKETGAIVGSCQSDEISLCFKTFEGEDHYFGGRFQKIATTCASLATGFFNKNLSVRLPEKDHLIPSFDGRCWSLTGQIAAYHNLLWRERDATKNSITMAATSVILHQKLHGVNGETKIQMLKDLGIDWHDYPTYFKRGVYVKRVSVLKSLDLVELAKIPLNNQPTGPVERSVVMELDLPPINQMKNYAAALFEKKISSHVELRDGTFSRCF